MCASSILLSFTRFLLVAGLALLALAYCASLPASQFLLMVTLPYLCLVAMCYLTKDTFRQSLRRVIQLSGSDLETGCENKLRLREALQAALALHKRYGTAVCALVFCVQSATEANASLPIPADAGLRKLCGLWRSRLRTTDRLFRLTDNRFVFLLLETGEAGATSLLQDLLHATHHYEIGELPTLQISHCCLPVQGVQSVDAWLANMMSHQCSV